MSFKAIGIGAIALLLLNPFLRADQLDERLTGGDFEDGGILWRSGYYPGGATTSSGVFQGPNAFEGQWYGYLGDVSSSAVNADGYLYQFLFPRPESDTLHIDFSFYINVTSEDTGNFPNDKLSVILRFFDDNLDFIKDVPFYDFSNRDREADGNPKTYHFFQGSYAPPSDVIGRWVSLVFKAKTDGFNSTTFRIDKVSAQIARPDPKFTVTGTAGNGGTIAPPGDQLVAKNGSVSFTAEPESAYVVDQWQVNGVAQQTGGNSYVLSPVTANAIVNVTFKIKMYTLTINGANGAISVDPQLPAYPHGGEITLTAIPAPGYFLCDWTGDAAGVGNTLRFRITKDTTVHALFKPFAPPISLLMAQSTSALGYQITLPPAPELMHIFQCSDDWYNWRNLMVLDGNQVNTINLNPTTTNPLEVFRTEVSPQKATPRFLNFPVRYRTSRNTEVSSIFDHANPSGHPDGIITSYRAETIKITSNNGWRYLLDLPKQRVNATPGSADYYANYSVIGLDRDPAKAKLLGFTYPDSGILWYDGHTGYDYVVSATEDVLAAASGYVVPAESVDCYNTICIDHLNGFRTYYLHLSERASKLVANGVVQPVWVDAGQYIGHPGKVACDGTIGVHLHFGVKQKDDNNNWIRVDPYGKYAENGDEIQKELWIQGQ